MGFLAEIVAEVREDISRPEYLASLPRVPVPGVTSLRAALSAGAERGALLAEYKRRSPAQGEEPFPVRGIGSFVERTPSADAYSCLATRPRFDGGPSDVARLRSHTAKPILFKDFVVDPVQVEAAWRAGASAVLLIARLQTDGLLDRPLSELADEVHRRGLEVVLEWHDRSELSRTGRVPADVYGVNARDLDSLQIDRTSARATLALAQARRPLLGLSGVESPADAAAFYRLGVDGLLVGSAIARSSDPDRLLTSLRRAPPEETP